MNKILSIFLLFISNISIAKDFLVGGWVPYWSADGAIETTNKYIDYIDEIGPFSFEVNSKGDLINPFNRKKDLWEPLFEKCRQKNIKIIPTIFWTKTDQMHEILSCEQNRERHINQIVDMVLKEKMQGININFERVSGADRESYIKFLKNLSKKLHHHGLLLYCTMGARTGDRTIGVKRGKKNKEVYVDQETKKNIKRPNVSLCPGDGEDAIRYKKSIVKYCDQVNIMGYDEWGKPCIYDEVHKNNKYYMSHASCDWIDQAIEYALTFVPAEKLVLGIPTYGIEFAIFGIHKDKSGNPKDLKFKKIRSMTCDNAAKLAESLGKVPHRAGGECCFTYSTDLHKERYVVYLDEHCVAKKIDLVKKYNIKGLYLFKIDGGETAGSWDVILKELKPSKYQATMPEKLSV